MSTDKKLGDPSMRSPVDVCRDPAYTTVVSRNGNTYPSSIELVVRHKQTGTLWLAYYTVRDDDSDADCGARWQEVEEKVAMVEKRTYEVKK